MIAVRKADERGQTRTDWLDSRHTFSFADYWDPRHQGFRALRVINDDVVEAGMGFGPHPHRDMEIITYVLEGALQHRDSLGHGSVIRPGEVQRMSAGTGIVHSEMNPSQQDRVRLLQIWILPERQDLAPSYEQRAYGDGERRGRLRLVASSDGGEGSVTVHQDVRVYAALLGAGARVQHELEPGRHAWVQMARGGVDVGGTRLSEGDGAAISDAGNIELKATSAAEILLFDLA